MLVRDSAYIGHAYHFITTPKRDTGALTMQDQLKNKLWPGGGRAGIWETEM